MHLVLSDTLAMPCPSTIRSARVAHRFGLLRGHRAPPFTKPIRPTSILTLEVSSWGLEPIGLPLEGQRRTAVPDLLGDHYEANHDIRVNADHAHRVVPQVSRSVSSLRSTGPSVTFRLPQEIQPG